MAGGPHQFRTRNNLNEPQQTRSKRNKNAAKSTNLIDILSLITVWLQVRVLPGPPVISVGCAPLEPFDFSATNRSTNTTFLFGTGRVPTAFAAPRK
jgi:hypothetical protein